MVFNPKELLYGIASSLLMTFVGCQSLGCVSQMTPKGFVQVKEAAEQMSDMAKNHNVSFTLDAELKDVGVETTNAVKLLSPVTMKIHIQGGGGK